MQKTFRLSDDNSSKKKPLTDGPGVCFPIPGMMRQICVINPGIGKYTSGPSVRAFFCYHDDVSIINLAQFCSVIYTEHFIRHVHY